MRLLYLVSLNPTSIRSPSPPHAGLSLAAHLQTLGREPVQPLGKGSCSEPPQPLLSPGSWTTSRTCVCPTTSPSPSPRSSSASVCWTPRTATSSSRPSEQAPCPVHGVPPSGTCLAPGRLRAGARLCSGWNWHPGLSTDMCPVPAVCPAPCWHGGRVKGHRRRGQGPARRSSRFVWGSSWRWVPTAGSVGAWPALGQGPAGGGRPAGRSGRALAWSPARPRSR